MPNSPPSDAIPIVRFSTDAFPERDRVGAWREVFGRTVVKLDIEPLNRNGFHAEATVCQVPGLGVLRASSPAVRSSLPRELIADDDVSFMAAPTCAYTASQLGRNAVLGPGDGVLMSNADVGSLTLASECRFTTFRVPRAAIAPLVPDLGAAFARRIRAGNAALQLLVSYLATALDTDALVAAELQQLAVTHVYDLLAVAMGATRDAAAIASGRGVPAARLRAAKAFRHATTRPSRSLGRNRGGASRRHAALRPHAVRDRDSIVLGIRAGAAARARAAHAHGSTLDRPSHQRHRVRRRLRRPIPLQPDLPPPLRSNSVGNTRAHAARWRFGLTEPEVILSPAHGAGCAARFRAGRQR